MLITSPAFDTSTCTHYGAVYADDRKLVEASLRRPDTLWKSGDPAEIIATETTQRSLSDGIYLGHFFPMFGHFLLETLPALSYGLTNDLPLIFHAWNTEDTTRLISRLHVQVCLEALGIGPSRIVFVTDPMRVSHLHIPERGNMMRGEPVTETLKVYSIVAEFAKTKMLDVGSRKIYLSRRLWQQRVRIDNEADIEIALARRGFRIVYPEQLHFLEQVGLLARARLVAGVRGSALHLGAFMGRGTRMIEITYKPMKQTHAVNDALGIKTENFFNGTLTRRDGEEALMTVNIDALNSFLTEFGY